MTSTRAEARPAGTYLDRVGAGDGWLVGGVGVAHGHDDRAGRGIALAVRHRVGELGAGGCVGQHGDPEGEAEHLFDLDALAGRPVDDADHIAIRVGVVLQHVHVAGVATADRDVVADRGRGSVLRRFVDADADVGGVAFAAVDDRVQEHVVAGDGREEEELTVVEQRDLVERVRVPARRHELGKAGHGQRVVVGVGVVLENVERDRHADHGGCRVVDGARLVVRRVESDGHPNGAVRCGAERVDDLVLELDGARLAAGLRREVDLPGRVEDHSAARHLYVAQDERVAVGVAVVVEHVERRRCAATYLGDVGLRDRRAVRRVVAHDVDVDVGRRRGTTPVAHRVRERDVSGETGRWHHLHGTLIGCDGDGHLGGHPVDGGDHQRVAVGVLVVGEDVDDHRLVGAGAGRVVAGHWRLVDAVLVDLRVTDLTDVGVLLGLPVLLIARVLVGFVTLGAERAAPVVDPFEFGVGAGDPERAAGEVVDPDPAVDETEPEGGRIGAGEGFGLVGHAVAHAGERGRRCGDVEDAPLVDERRQRLAGSDLVEWGECRSGCGVDAAEHLATGRDRDEWRVLWGRLGEDRGDGRLRIGGRGAPGRGVGRVVGGLGRDGWSDEGVVTVVEPDDRAVGAERDHVAADGADRGEFGGRGADVGPVHRFATQRVADTDPARLGIRIRSVDWLAASAVDDHQFAVERRGHQSGALRLEERGDVVERHDRPQVVPRERPHPEWLGLPDDHACVDGADANAAGDRDRVDDLVRAGVDDLEFAGRGVVGDDGRVGLLDVELRPRVRDPDEPGDLAGRTVHLSDDAVGSANEPGATVVGLGADGGSGVGVDRGDDHGCQRGDHEADHDHFT